MLPLLRLAVPFVLFPGAAVLVLRLSPRAWTLPLFAVVNVVGMLGLCILTPMSGLLPWQLTAYLSVAVAVFAIYLATVLLHHALVRWSAQKQNWHAGVALLFPIFFMVVVKYVPALAEPFRIPLQSMGKTQVTEFFVGVSYMAFRLSHMAMEVRNGIVPVPSVWEHLSFAFFVPTIAVGPISRYSVFRQSLYHPSREDTPLGRSVQRLVIGATKYLFLATLLQQLSYGGLLRDSHSHPRIDLPVAAVGFFVYLYLNFSGYCDMAIGTAGLLGIRVEENFDRPFRSRNMQEFWTRWHITLSNYMKDMVFAPLSKALIRRFGPQSAPHAIAAAIMMVFIAMGLWHGLTWNFVIYGVLNGLGVAACHYYTIWLTKKLGKKGYVAYNTNTVAWAAGVVLTFVFMTCTLFFFDNDLQSGRQLLDLLTTI